MTKAGDVGESGASDDSISLTSTVSSTKTERYEVECILAEQNSKGFMEYLTAWSGYPENCYSWEPRDCFFEDEVFSDWTRTKMRVTKGLEKPFDVNAWKRRCKAIERETRLRRERRQDKKLRLSNRGQLTSAPGEVDANVESSSSEPAPRRSDKRIKRRSVHQDSPPSSSISEPSPTPTSEDSDKPLTSRQGPETFTPKSKWTQGETIALEEGLRTLKGPRWRDLLGLYGRNGTISQVLKDKMPSDLYDKAKSVRQEFVDSGREPPEYLKAFSNSASSKGSGTATPVIYSESRDQSRAASEKSRRSTSAGSMMAELHERQRNREAIDRENRRPQQTTNPRKILNPASGRRKEPNTPKALLPGKKPRHHQDSQASAQKVEDAFARNPPEETPRAAQTNPQPSNGLLHAKTTIEVKEGSKSDSLRDTQSKDGPVANEPSETITNLQAECRSKNLAHGANETTKSALIAAVAEPESSGTNVLVDNTAMREETARATWSGTAREPAVRPSVPKPSRLGAVGSGPARTSSSKLKHKLGQIEPKKPSVMGDVTAAWNVEPKKRKSNNWATTNADPVDGQAQKRNYRLSVQNRIYKSRRDGRAPDPNRLVFIDPKTGKAPTAVPAPSAAAKLSKTPLQLHQEELATRQAEEHQAQEFEDAMFSSASEPDPQPQSIDHNGEIRADEQKVPKTGRSLSNSSALALRSMSGDIANGPAYIDSLTPPPQASPRFDPPLMAPLGPRIDAKRIATISLQDYTQRSTSSTNLLKEALINPDQPNSSNDPSRFTLRSYPSFEAKNEIFNKPDTNLVIGDIKIGKDNGECYSVKLVGFEFETKKILLTVKSMPRTVHFVFDTVCLASEYKTYFPAVSP